MFPISEVIYAKRSLGNDITWNLIDLYRIGPNYSLQFMDYGSLDENKNIKRGNEEKSRIHYFGDTAISPTGARRRDLGGIVIPCGLAVCILFNCSDSEDC